MSATPFIIPVFIPQAGCPHQCVFCNQEIITGKSCQVDFRLEQEKARQTVMEYLNFRRDNGRKTELAFFGGNFLGLKPCQIAWYVRFAIELYESGLINALRFSTRPDTITPENLDMLQGLPVSVIELGAQAMHDHVLHLSGRGHTVSDTVRAVALIQEYGFAAGLQIMPGLPGDTPELALTTGHRIVELEPVCVRIYPTIVLAGSKLAQMYRAGSYQPLSLDDAVNITADLYKLFRQNNINVIRMGLQADASLQDGITVLAGPYHPAFGHLVISRLFWRCLQAALSNMADVEVAVTVHPSQVSHVRGLNNANVKAWQQAWPQKELRFSSGHNLAKTQVDVNGRVFDII